MIRFENITLKAHRQTLLDGANLNIAQGEKAVVCGPSGCGKSSLLRSAVGATPLAAGAVHIDRIKLSAATVADLRARIAFIGQEPVLGAERVREALLLPFTFKAHQHARPDEDLIFQTLERLHLDPAILEKPAKRISGGEKQRIAIGRALLLNKTIFLADEVSSALDPESRSAVMKELFIPEITLLSVSHDPAWIEACSRTVDIEDRQLREVHP